MTTPSPPPAEPSTQADAEREAFEAWAKKNGLDLTRTTGFPNWYARNETVTAWESWQAALRTPAATTAGVEESWRCFHCDEVFTDRDAALAHFGPSCTDTPVCQIPALAEMLRDMQRELTDMRNEDLSQSAKEYHALGARHYVKEREAEQSGYDKGLADGRAEAADASKALTLTEEELRFVGLLQTDVDTYHNTTDQRIANEAEERLVSFVFGAAVAYSIYRYLESAGLY